MQFNGIMPQMLLYFLHIPEGSSPGTFPEHRLVVMILKIFSSRSDSVISQRVPVTLIPGQALVAAAGAEAPCYRVCSRCLPWGKGAAGQGKARPEPRLCPWQGRGYLGAL